MRRRSLARTLKNDLIWHALRFAAAAGRKPSLRAARRLGCGLGALAGKVLPAERRRVMHNLERAFPSSPETERRRIADEMFRHLGLSLLEIAWLPNLDRAALEVTTRIEGLEHFDDAHRRGKGVVLFTGHCGNWEWMAATIGLLGFSMNVVAREIYDPRINEFVVASRARHGVETIGRGSGNAAREILATLRKGHILGVLIDQSIKAENVDMEFFAHPAPTPVGPARLAIRAGAAAIAGFIERRGDMQIIRFEPAHQTTRDEDPVELTRRMTAAIEQQIRRVPSQWVWMHRRWSAR